MMIVMMTHVEWDEIVIGVSTCLVGQVSKKNSKLTPDYRTKLAGFKLFFDPYTTEVP